jgi:hypothetical protein
VAPEPRVGVRSPFRQSLPQTHASDAVEPTAFFKSNYTSARQARTMFYLRFRPPSHVRLRRPSKTWPGRYARGTCERNLEPKPERVGDTRERFESHPRVARIEEPIDHRPARLHR